MANPPVCYFIVSPNPALIPGGVVDAIGPHFYIKFGDGEVLPANYRYSTHNPSYNQTPCFNVDGNSVYAIPNTNNPGVRIGRYLQNRVLARRGLVQIGNTEWFVIRPGLNPGGIGALQAWLVNVLANFGGLHFDAGVQTSQVMGELRADELFALIGVGRNAPPAPFAIVGNNFV